MQAPVKPQRNNGVAGVEPRRSARSSEGRRPNRAGQPVSWSHEVNGDALTCWHYVHSLDDLIGRMCDTGFVVLAFRERSAGDPAAEPGTLPHLAAYAPTFFWVLARRRAT